MQGIVNRTIGALALALTVSWAIPMVAEAGNPVNGSVKGLNEVSEDGTMLKISARSAFPVSKKISIGIGRSMMIQFPMELRDVMIADPSKADAIGDRSKRANLRHSAHQAAHRQ